MLKQVIRTNFSQRESRRDRRYLLPLVVNFAGIDYPTVNWSLTGFLLAAGDAALAKASVRNGTLKIPGSSETYEFTAEIVRRNKDTIAFRFRDSSPKLFRALDRLPIRYLTGRLRQGEARGGARP